MKIVLIILVYCVMFLTPANSEEIYMRNGDKLTGNLVSVNSSNLIIETQYGKIDVSKENITKIIFSRSNDSEIDSIDNLSIEEILLFIKNSKRKFYIETKRISGESLSNSLRTKKMMNAPGLKDIKIFADKFLTRTENGKLIKVLESSGKKVNLVDWLDAKNSSLQLKGQKKKMDNKERYSFKRVRTKSDSK